MARMSLPTWAGSMIEAWCETIGGGEEALKIGGDIALGETQPNGVLKNLPGALFGTPRGLGLAFAFDVLKNGEQLFRRDFTDRTIPELGEQ
jgi:hypothetical protein